MPIPPQFIKQQASSAAPAKPGAAPVPVPGKPGAAKGKARLRLKAKPTKGKKVPPQFAKKGAPQAGRAAAMDVLKQKAAQAAGKGY